jgi:hypothetical protein
MVTYKARTAKNTAAPKDPIVRLDLLAAFVVGSEPVAVALKLPALAVDAVASVVLPAAGAV